jgi:hypothetical protein
MIGSTKGNCYSLLDRKTNIDIMTKTLVERSACASKANVVAIIKWCYFLFPLSFYLGSLLFSQKEVSYGFERVLACTDTGSEDPLGGRLYIHTQL